MNKDIELLIETSIHSDIDGEIKNNLSISPEVEEISDEISNTISDKIKTEEYTGFDDIEICKFSFSSKFENVKISVNVTNYNFSNKKEYNRLKSKYESLINESNMMYPYDCKFCIFNINSCSIGKKLNKVITNDNIQHEVSHFYQMFMAKSILPNDDIYPLAYQNINSNDTLLSCISILLYYSYNFEQDGYVNGLNQFIKSHGDKNPLSWEDIKESSAYKAILNFRKCLHELNSNYETQEIETKLRKVYDMSYNNFLNLLKIKEKRFLKKIGRVFYKHQKKCINGGTRVNESFNQKNYFIFY